MATMSATTDAQADERQAYAAIRIRAVTAIRTIVSVVTVVAATIPSPVGVRTVVAVTAAIVPAIMTSAISHLLRLRSGFSRSGGRRKRCSRHADRAKADDRSAQ